MRQLGRMPVAGLRESAWRGREFMAGAEQRLRDSAGLAAILDDLARSILDGRRPGSPLALVGIRSRGVPLAERLAGRLEATAGVPVPVGAVDITLYRDDLDAGGRWPVLRGTDIPFQVDGADLVLVDDVLYTGRTVRAALNAVCDLGRPGRVRLAVVVDRGHHELPIRADAVGMKVAAPAGDLVRVRVEALDGVDEIVTIAAEARAGRGGDRP